MVSGLEILRETIETCEAVGEGLGSIDGASPQWEESMTAITDALSGMAVSFFFKTMPGIPPSRACLRDAAALKGLRDGGEWDAFPEGLKKLQKAVEDLARKATMKGIVLT